MHIGNLGTYVLQYYAAMINGTCLLRNNIHVEAVKMTGVVECPMLLSTNPRRYLLGRNTTPHIGTETWGRPILGRP